MFHVRDILPLMISVLSVRYVSVRREAYVYIQHLISNNLCPTSTHVFRFIFEIFD